MLTPVIGGGRTPLHWAAQAGRTEAAKLLLAHGVDLQARGQDGKTAEDDATKAGHTALASYLAAERAKLLAVTKAPPPRPQVAAVAPVVARAAKPRVTVAPPPRVTAALRTEKPQAAVAPLAVLGKISEVQQRVVFTSLESYLSTSYQLISADEFRQAQETAYSVLDLEQCTEEQCIRKIQEILQVERLFVLQVLREETFTQLSLTLVRLDDRLVKVDTCENCSISALNAKVEGLVAATVAADGN